MAVLEAEEGNEDVLDLFKLPESNVAIPFMALMEVEYKVRRKVGPARAELALTMIESWPAIMVESTPAWRHEAAVVKAGHRLSLADSWIAALALTEKAILVHKDPEFDPIKGLQHFRLPYKPKQA
jgi:ribonuclease VapC